MKTSADFWVFIGCLFVFCWYMGFVYGQQSVPKVVCPKLMPMYESKGGVQYWRDYKKGLPK